MENRELRKKQKYFLFSLFLVLGIFILTRSVFAEEEMLVDGTCTEMEGEEGTAELSDGTSNELSDEPAEDESLSGEERSDRQGQSAKAQIVYENGIHYMKDGDYPGERFIIYCMNNKRHWPHWTESMGNAAVPDYTNGYLTSEDFQSPEEYEKCMRQLSKILYAGYPYNGEHLFQIVTNSQELIPTEEQFDNMLVPLSVLQTAFPELRNHSFTYQDWVAQNNGNLNILKAFTSKVVFLEEGQQIGGLAKEEIEVMPFFKAAWCMVADTQGTPLERFGAWYSSSYLVTEEQAYSATQMAIWRLLHYYNIPDNDVTDMHLSQTKLGENLYQYSRQGGLLDYEPTVDNLKVKGDLNFTYHPEDGKWHSGTLQIIEPEEYHGIYKLILPKGIKAICEHSTYVYGGEMYELIADHQPQVQEYFGIETDMPWLKEFRQYTPMPDIEVNGKKFQHMIGGVIRYKKLTLQIIHTATAVGSLEISKTVVGEKDNEKEFKFELKLPQHKINGPYGDLIFKDGIAVFTMKNGQTVRIVNIPANAEYMITEKDTGEYSISSTNSQGKILADQVIRIEFTNTKNLHLLISKLVTGEAGDKIKKFRISVTAKKQDGTNLQGVFPYEGSVAAGYEKTIEPPENGNLFFKDGRAEIVLSHGQQIMIKNLPRDYICKAEERTEDRDGYTTDYQEIETEEGKEIKIVNNKEFVPDTGITDDNDQSIYVAVAIALMGSLLAGLSYVRQLGKRLK